MKTLDETALIGCLRDEYGLDVRDIRPANRGFYGLTWKAVTDEGTRFIKADPWPQHQQGFRDGLEAVRYLMDHGVDFIPELRFTMDGRLSVPHQGTVLAVFDYLEGEHLEHASVIQQYGQLARVYRLGTAGLKLPGEDFLASVLVRYKHLREQDSLPREALSALEAKADLLSHAAERLRAFSAICRAKLDGFFLTHGDAGGNCILMGEEPFLVDWDSAMIAPPERDAWINIWNPQALKEIDGILMKEGLSYQLRIERLCYYCYDWFYRYLVEHLEVILYARDPQQRSQLIRGLQDYLENGWIFRQLEAADHIELPPDAGL